MNKKIAYLDVLRLFATFIVVLIHTVSGVSTLMPDSMTEVQLKTYECIKSMCTIGVPIFLMISGSLFLDPDKKVGLRDLFTKYVRRIVLSLLIFGTGYAFIEIIFNTRDYKPIYLWEAFYNMLVGNTWGHMWYLYMLVLVYLLIPILKPFVSACTKGEYTYVILLLVVVTSIVPFVRQMTGFGLGLGVSAVQITEFGVYICYFLVGYYIHKYSRESEVKRKIFTVLAGVISAICFILIILNSYRNLGLYIYYDSPIVLLFSISIFFLFGGYKKEAKLAYRFRPYLFGIYLVHTFYLNLLYKLVGFTPLACGGYILIPVFVIMVFALSAVTVWVMRLIPPLKKYVL